MNDVIVLQHAASEGTGFLGVIFGRYRVAHRVVRVFAGDAVPGSAAAAAGLVLLGGPMNVGDGHPYLEAEQRLIRDALERNVPVLGICLGAQLIAAALGARVYDNPVPEIGWFPVRQTADPEAYRWFSGLGASFDVFQWHGQTFDVPPSGRLVLEGVHCRHQAFVAGSALALQGHLEMTESMVRDWATHLPPVAPTVQSAEEILRGLPARVQDLQRRAESIFSSWLSNRVVP
jgi:GMP synthase-like glutamine amidotransferase